MDIISMNADVKILNLAISLGQSPKSWRGWYGLNIKLDNLDQKVLHECLSKILSLLDKQFLEVDGSIYFCLDGNIHIVSKNVSLETLESVGVEICDIAYAESLAHVTYHLYELSRFGEAHAYELDIMQQQDGIPKTFNSENVSTYTQSLDEQFVLNFYPIKKKQALIKRKVLLVEDDIITCCLVKKALSKACEVIAASTAEEALSKYISYKPELTFLDINLPDKNGYNVLEWIMRDDPVANVVMFSSEGCIDNIVRALEVGAKGFIGKPFNKEQLLDYV